MALFYIADSITLCCSNVETAKQFWIDAFECKPTKVPADWDDPLPSDVALKLPGDDEPRVLLCDRSEVERAGFDRGNERPIIFCRKTGKARDYLMSRGLAPGPIQDGGGTEFFEIRDAEGVVIEICKEP